MITRRRLMVAGGAFAALGIRPAAAASLADDFRRIEAENGGRLGVAMLDTATGARASHRADERFPMCSTFKLLAAAAVLSRADAGTEHLDRLVQYGEHDLVTYSPVTKTRVASGMTLDALCKAAVTLSDNTAGNLLLAAIGGPAGLTAYARSLGDTMTRLDRIEPALNAATPGDPRDTTTPAAMTQNLQTLVLGTALSTASRDKLSRWLVGNMTGDTRLRAGLPQGWRVGDRTGTGSHGTNNDVGIIWPPDRAPVVLSAYLTETALPMEKSNAAHVAVAKAVAASLEK